MGKRLIRSLGSRLLMAGFIVLVATLSVRAALQKDSPDDARRADILVIDTLASFGALERPPVVFLHDKHTQAAARLKKDCLACHPKLTPADKADKPADKADKKDKTDRLSLKFQRTQDMDKQSVMDLYHDQCITCHKQSSGPDNVSGPVTCGECHVENAATPSNWRAIGLDKSLHLRHVKANEQKCENCHHDYNAQTKTLFYAKGKEGACLYCHREQTEENRISNRLASHAACVGCHRQVIGQGHEAGPLECAGCHDPARQAKIEKVTDVARMERNQPDAVLVKTRLQVDAAAPPPATMPPVPFDHKAHETYNDSCRVCHHADLGPCVRCHTLEGHVDGKQVKLAQAMHQKEAQASCIGCHRDQQSQPQCAGCHASIAPARTLTAETACRVCHMPTATPVTVPDDEAQARIMAGRMLEARLTPPTAVPVDQIPETVTIQHLSAQYEAVAMPHRRIVLKLQSQIAGNPLADRFHTDPTTLCQGCHHNSPGSLKPPQCGSCHGRSSEALNLNRPGLLAAYHQQCLECHDRMGIEKPAARDCIACHPKRAS